MSTDSSPPNIANDVNGAAFENSAHPPIHLLNVALTPEEFGLVFRANQAEVAVYQIVFDAQKPNDDLATLQESTLTLYRKQEDRRRQVGVQFRALGAAREGWLSDAPDHGEMIVGAAPNNREMLQALAAASEGEIDFEIEDCLTEAAGMPLIRLLHSMEAARIGRPSTYAVTLKKLFEGSELLAFESSSGKVRLTPDGAELAARLETRCDNLSSVEFARNFDGNLDAMASGLLPPKDFLAWVLSLTHPDDPLAAVAAAKLWDSVDDLRADRLAETQEFGGNGGYINSPLATKPEPASS